MEKILADKKTVMNSQKKNIQVSNPWYVLNYSSALTQYCLIVIVNYNFDLTHKNIMIITKELTKSNSRHAHLLNNLCNSLNNSLKVLQLLDSIHTETSFQ